MKGIITILGNAIALVGPVILWAATDAGQKFIETKGNGWVAYAVGLVFAFISAVSIGGNIMGKGLKVKGDDGKVIWNPFWLWFGFAIIVESVIATLVVNG